MLHKSKITYQEKYESFLLRKTIFLLCFGFLLILDSQGQIPIDTSHYIKDNPNIYSILVSRNGHIIYKKYFGDYTEKSLFNDQSLTKSIVSILIGIAIDKGYIKSVDEKAADFLPELKNDPDKRKQEISIREIMNQASGFYHEELTAIPDFLQLPNPSDYVLKAPLVTDPGKTFHYNNAASHLLSVIISKSTNIDSRSFAKKYLFDPLGVTEFDWAKMKDGYFDGSGLLSIRLRSEGMLKIGELLLHGGVFDGKQIVSSKWVNLILNPDIFYHTEWGFDQSNYALCWYHCDYKGTKLIYGMGWGGQFLILVPSLQAIIVINESHDDATAVQQSTTFIHRIFPMIFEQLK